MEKQDPIISLLKQEKILDEKTLQAVIDRQQKTGQSLISILKKENLLDDDQLIRVIAGAHLKRSVMGREIVVVESFKLGVTGYTIKPVDYEKFVEAIRIIDTYNTPQKLGA